MPEHTIAGLFALLELALNVAETAISDAGFVPHFGSAPAARVNS